MQHIKKLFNKISSLKIPHQIHLSPAIIIMILLILFIHAVKYLPFISDDSLISLRYARRLLQGYGLTWTEGVPVEGYSNLLWILSIAAIGFFNVDLIFAARLLGFVCMGTTIVIFVLFYFRTQKSILSNIIPVTVGGLFFVLSVPNAVWAIGGMEQPLIAALLAPVLILNLLILTNEYNHKNYWVLSLFLGLLSITRIDGYIYTLITISSLFIIKGVKRNIIYIQEKRRN